MIELNRLQQEWTAAAIEAARQVRAALESPDVELSEELAMAYGELDGALSMLDGVTALAEEAV